MPCPLLRTTAITLGMVALATSLFACAPIQPADSGAAPDTAATTLAAPAAASAAGDEERPAGWSEESHSNDVDPNYAVVFPNDAVHTMTITLAPDDWAAMQADMEEMYGEARARSEALAAMSAEERAAFFEQMKAAEEAPSNTVFGKGTPMWVPGTITVRGQDWTHVGVRYKGVSSLSPWISGDLRLPFKFDFDQFEDDYPAIKNQRFFGFKQLSLASNYGDPADMRDIVVYELLADAGLPSLHTASYELVLEYGEGPVRLGIYTVIEVVDDTGVPGYFGSDDGNIYEGEGDGASLAAEHADKLEESFQKKNNEKQEDWSDIQALFDVLHDPKRTTDAAGWRANLETIFDVDGFLEWLGIAAFVGHVDTYGFAAHNYYLYNNPATGQLTWFSWDHNGTFGRPLLPFVTLDKADVTDAWPLIRYLLDDPIYWDRYVELMAENLATVLAPDAVIAKIRAHPAVIAPSATPGMSREEYDAAVQVMVDFVELRAAEVEDFLAGQE
jgi:spore coat protein H